MHKTKRYILEIMESIIFDVRSNPKIHSQLTDVEIENMEDHSELKVHKILYFLYGFYYRQYQKELFDPEFQAWKYGPVEINYRKHPKIFQLNFLESEEGYIKKVVLYFMKINSWDLVEMSHQTEPWLKLYKGKNEMFISIPKDIIQNYFLHSDKLQ